MELSEAEVRYIERYREWAEWLRNSMPTYFYKVTSSEEQAKILLYLQDIESSGCARFSYHNAVFIVRIYTRDSIIDDLETYQDHNILSSEIHISSRPAVVHGKEQYIQVHKIIFYHRRRKDEESLPVSSKMKAVQKYIESRYRNFPIELFEDIYRDLDRQFLSISAVERIARYMNLYALARDRDGVYVDIEQVQKDADHDRASTRLMLATINVPKTGFFLNLARVMQRFNYNLERCYVSTVQHEGIDMVAIITFYLTDEDGKQLSGGEKLNIFLEELSMVKWVNTKDILTRKLIEAGLLNTKQANFLRAVSDFIHQVLADVDRHQFKPAIVDEAFTRHPEISEKLFKYFDARFNPVLDEEDIAAKTRKELLGMIEGVDTGIPSNDKIRKAVLKAGMIFVDHILKTNYYISKIPAISFRLNPEFIKAIIPNCSRMYPEMPFGVFYISGRDFKGYHIRFRELARGGLRTLIPPDREKASEASDQLFRECYSLAYTQQKKNKDIPEGGAKGVILLDVHDKVAFEVSLYERENKGELSESQLKDYQRQKIQQYVFEAQRVYVDTLLDLLIPVKMGSLLRDYYGKEEAIYLGPDENMSDDIILWIANQSKERGYFPGRAFMSGKPDVGINHKYYGVTSAGVNVYLGEVLKYSGFDPSKEKFTVKFSGGPDGDVAGNEMKIMINKYGKNVSIVAITDGSGAIYNPDGLDNDIILKLVKEGKMIEHYPPERLSAGGYLLVMGEKKAIGISIVHTALYTCTDKGVEKKWIGGSEANRIYGHQLFKVYADAFIPAGGRPRMINAENCQEYIMADGRPSSRFIIEGANLYLTDEARISLEEKGVVVIRDSSANKCGVICSSYEVLAGLLLDESEFIEYKEEYVRQVMELLEESARKEAHLLLSEHERSGESFTALSEKISSRINDLTDEISAALSQIDSKDKIISRFDHVLQHYLPPILYEKYAERIGERLSLVHLRAIVASRLASDLIYKFGTVWRPTISDMMDSVGRTLYA